MHDRRFPLSRYVIVATLSLAVGVGVSFLVLRSRHPESTNIPATTQHEGMAGMTEKTAPGSKAVYISSARQQLIGVRTDKVARRPLVESIRTVGTVAYDETRVAQINTKVNGWVDHVFVDYVGKWVAHGAPLFSLYSPELVATQSEYLRALKARASAGARTQPGVESLIEASRGRLKLFDMTEAQIAELERTGKASRTVTLYAPFHGVVLERNAFPGQYLTPEMSALRIVDLSSVWVIGQIFEYELPLVKTGQSVEIEFPYEQGMRRLEGRIAYIYPDVDPQTRRVRIRAEFRNPGLQFKPESYVTVLIRGSGGTLLSVSKESVIDSGTQQYVIVALPDGYFEPREVQVGEPIGDFYPVLAGVSDGENVVTSAHFLIDSETNLQAAMKSMSMSMPGMKTEGGGTETPSGSTPGSNGKRGVTDKNTEGRAMPGMKTEGDSLSGARP